MVNSCPGWDFSVAYLSVDVLEMLFHLEWSWQFFECNISGHPLSFSLLRINTIVLTFIVRSLCEKSLFLCAVPDGQGDNTELEVYRFKHPGGVAMSMYNTDEVLSRITWMIVDWSLYVWNFIFLCWTVNTSFCWGFNEYCSPKEMAPLS